MSASASSSGAAPPPAAAAGNASVAAAVSSSASAVDGKWYLPGSTPSYVVSSFVKHIQPLRALRGGSKQYITAFARWYFSKKPQLSAPDVRLLLLGDGERKGVMETCGALKGLTAGAAASELRGSAVLALELLLMLLDVSVNGARAEEMLRQLQQASDAQLLQLRLLQAMRLERHLLASASASPLQSEFACKLILILEETLPQLRGRRELWLGSAEAVRLFDRWRQEREAALQVAMAAEAEEDDDATLTSWQQVKLDDVDAADLQANAALAELIDDVDAQAEREGGQNDPLGISSRVVAAQRQQQDGAGRDRIGKAGKKMQQLWQQITAASADGSRQSQSPPQSASQQHTAQQAAGGGGGSSSGLMSSVLPARGGISTDSDDFSPVHFLSSVHSSTPLSALHRGLSHLQRSLNNRQQALKLLVAEHFGQYVHCFPESDTRILTSWGMLYLEQIETLQRQRYEVLFGCYDVQSQQLLYRKGDLVFPKQQPKELLEFNSQGEAARWTTVSGDHGTEDSPTSCHVSLRVTLEHSMYVQLGSRDVQGMLRWSSTRGRRHPFTRKAPLAVPKPHSKMQAQHLQSDDPREFVRMLACAQAGYAPQDTRRRDAVRADLGLLDDKPWCAFIELLGFWLADGSLAYNLPVDGASRGYVTFSQVKETDLAWLRSLLEEAGLQEGDGWLSGSSGKPQTTLYIREPIWFAFFDKEFGRKHPGSQSYSPAAAASASPGRCSSSSVSASLDRRASLSSVTTAPTTPPSSTGDRRFSVSFSSHRRKSADVDMELVPVSPRSLASPARRSSLPRVECCVCGPGDASQVDDGSAAMPIDLTGAVVPRPGQPLEDEDERLGAEEQPDGPLWCGQCGDDECRATDNGEEEEDEPEDDEPSDPDETMPRSPPRSFPPDWGFWWVPDLQPEPTESVQLLPGWTLQELTATEMRLLIAGLHRADGFFAGDANEIHTSSHRFRDQLVQALLHCGYSACAGLMYRKGSVRGYRLHSQAIDQKSYSVSFFDALSAAEKLKYVKIEATADVWNVRWSQLVHGFTVSAAGSCWPSMSRQDCVTRVPRVAERDGRTWCVEVKHKDNLIIAQRAHRDSNGNVTKQSRPIVVGNCLDTIDHLHQLMGSEVVDSASRAVRIRQLLEAINRDATQTFGSVMERKAGSDRMRATLQALHSHRFLFAMTGELQQYADSRQWPQLVRLYEKAKHCIVLSEQSAAAADLPSLVLQEVFARFSAVRCALFRQLSAAQLPLDEQVRAISVLQQLDCDVDPAWYFLHQQALAVCSQMEAAVHAAAGRTQQQRQHEEDAGAAAAASDPLLSGSWNPFGSLLLANPAVLGPPAAAAADRLPPLSPSARYLSEPVVASQLQHLIHRLCSVVSHAVPDILRLAQLVATQQLSSLAQTATTAAVAAAAPLASSPSSSSAAASLADVSSSDRTAIQSLLSRVLHDFSAYVRLVLFPVTADTLRQWQHQQQQQQQQQEAAGLASGGGFSPPTSPQPQRSSPPARLPAVLFIPASPRQADGHDDAAAVRPSQLSGAVFAAGINRAAEHDKFSMEELTAATSSSASLLPLVPAPPAPSALPLPGSVQQSVSELLRCLSLLQELQPALPADSLQPVSSLRTVVIRWFVAQTLHSARTAIEELEAHEDWSIAPVEQAERAASRRQQQSAQRQRTTMRHTALPARFQAVMQTCIAAFTAIPSLKAKWLIKLIAAPALDCMAAFAQTLQRLTEQQQESSVRLLLLLTNARHCRLHVLPTLLQQLLSLFASSTHSVLTAAFQRSVSPPFELLDDALLQLLLRLQLSRLHAGIRDSVYSREAVQSLLLLSQRSASAASSLRTRGCVIAALLDVVGMHAELFALCPALLPRCLQALQAAALQSVLWCLSNEHKRELWQQQPQLVDVVLLECDFFLAVLQPSVPTATAAVAAAEAQQSVADIATFLFAALQPLASDQRDDGEAERWLVEGRQRRAPQLKRDLDRTAAMFACFQPEPAAGSGQRKRRQQQQQAQQPVPPLHSNSRSAQHDGGDEELDEEDQEDLQLEDDDDDDDDDNN